MTITTDSDFAVREIIAQPISNDLFEPFGAVLEAMEDGTPFTEQEAMLDVSGGTPRFYLMHLEDKPPVFSGITRHRKTTQSLVSVGGHPWLLAVAPPLHVDDSDAVPDLDDIRAFIVPGDVAVLLKRGTWHSGPHFTEPERSFVNLELADTNQVDHQTYRLDRALGVTVQIVAP